jgi:hypothetical protein
MLGGMIATRRARQRGLGLAVAVAVCPFLFEPLGAAPKEAPPKDVSGKVVPLAGVLEKFGAKLDRDASPAWLALVTDDGKVYPLIKDDGSRRFFKDERLLNRSVRLTGREFGDTKLFQVLSVRGLVNGKPHELFYWCDICSIKRYEKMDCECCGGDMILKEEPVGP